MLDYMRIMRGAEEEKLKQLYEEQTAIDTADFQFQSRQTEETYVDKLSNSLLLYPAPLVLYARQCCIEPVFDYTAFATLLRYFNCSNMRVHVTAPLSQQPEPSQPWLSAPWYGTQYRVSSLTDSFEACLGMKAATDGDLQAALEVGSPAPAFFVIHLSFAPLCILLSLDLFFSHYHSVTRTLNRSRPTGTASSQSLRCLLHRHSGRQTAPSHHRAIVRARCRVVLPHARAAGASCHRVPAPGRVLGLRERRDIHRPALRPRGAVA